MATNRAPATPLPHQPQAPQIPARYKFPANDPIFKQAKRLFRINPWIRGLMTLQDLAQYLYDEQQRRGGMPHALIFNPTAAGFTLSASCATPSGGPSGLAWGYSNAQTTGCLTGNLAYQPLSTPIPASQNSYNLMWQNPNVPSQRQVVQRYTRTGSYPTQALTRPMPVPKPVQVPKISPEIFPETYPFEQPAYAPRTMPVPYRNLPSIETPFKESGYETQPQKNHRRSFERNANPDIVLESHPSGGIAINTRPSNHGNTKPPIGARERKIKSGAYAAASITAGAVTETADFVQALWEALPWKYRKVGYSGKPQDKLRDIYNNLGKVDMLKALKNVASNQIEDYAYGYFPSKMKPINQQVFKDQRGILLGSKFRNVKR